MDVKEGFEKAAQQVYNLNMIPSDDELFSLYALYKQSIVGDVNTGGSDLEKINRWDAWKKYEGMPKEEAMAKYINFVNQLEASA